jgi:MerR family copper efflux transcriptional regulator
MQSLTIGALAKRGGVHLETIRYYERRGLMPPPARKSSGHRAYASAAVERLQFIRRAQALGFSLAEIKELLAFKAPPDRSCAEAAKRIQDKLREIEEKIKDLRAIQRTLSRMKKSCEGHCLVSECPILESLER